MFEFERLAATLKRIRKKHKLSLNKLAKATGVSRRTLQRIEEAKAENRKEKIGSPGHESRVTSHPSASLRAGKSRAPRLSARTAYKLARALLGEQATRRALDDATRLSRFLGPDPLYKLLDVLYHYPAFLFHEPPPEIAKELDRPLGGDPSTSLRAGYRHSLDLLLRSGFGTRNLGARVRAFRMQHDLTLIEAADLLGLSKSELHRLERAERRPSPRTRYKILRLLTLPIPAASRSAIGAEIPSEAEGRLLTLPVAAHPAVRGMTHQERLATLKALLSLPPPRSDAPSSAETLSQTLSGAEGSGVEGLRHLWLAGSRPARELAAALGVSQPHLIRLLRGDRRPSRALRARIAALTGSL